MQTLFDVRGGAGYSCLTRMGPDQAGVLEEGPGQIDFQRFAIDELVK